LKIRILIWVILLGCLPPLSNKVIAADNSSQQAIDSLDRLLQTKLSKFSRLDILHKACELLYKNDTDNELLYHYAKEGVELAKKLDAHEQGSDLAVPLYSEIYSYLEYGKLREAEQKMIEYEELTDKSNPQQLAYYLDTYAVFKRKARDYEDAAKALSKFADITKKIEDKRFLVTALSRNAEFYLVDSLNYEEALYKMEEISEFDEVYSQISIDSFAEANKIIHKDYYTFSGDIKFDEGAYKKACKNYKKAVQFLEHSDFSTMELLTEKIEKCYVKLDDFKTAFIYSNRLNVLKDSLYNVQNIKATQFFESKK